MTVQGLRMLLFLSYKLHIYIFSDATVYNRPFQSDFMVFTLWYIVLLFYSYYLLCCDRLGGLVVRVSGYRYRGLGFDPRRYQIF